jgi:hypothetical protein
LHAPPPFFMLEVPTSQHGGSFMTNITGDSQEAVAYALLEQIAGTEDWMQSGGQGEPWRGVDRAKILDTYAECLLTVKSPGKRKRT